MANYNIYFKKSAKKELENLPQKELEKIIKKIQSLAINPRDHGSEKLSGDKKYRIRQGNYRVIYSIEDTPKAVWIFKIAHRKDVYN